MTNKEVVITHLDDLRLFADVTVHPVVSPDNWDVYSSLCDYIDQIKTEVEILLKEQEPKPVELHTNAYGTKFYFCPKCKRELFHTRNLNFCERCGQAVKWG